MSPCWSFYFSRSTNLCCVRRSVCLTLFYPFHSSSFSDCLSVCPSVRLPLCLPVTICLSIYLSIPLICLLISLLFLSTPTAGFSYFLFSFCLSHFPPLCVLSASDDVFVRRWIFLEQYVERICAYLSEWIYSFSLCIFNQLFICMHNIIEGTQRRGGWSRVAGGPLSSVFLFYRTTLLGVPHSEPFLNHYLP